MKKIFLSLFILLNLMVLANVENFEKVEKLKYTPVKTVLIPMKSTDETEEIESDYYKIKQNNKYGIADLEGNIIYKCVYDDVKLNEYGNIVLIKDGAQTIANPIKNKINATTKTLESIVGLPVTIVAGAMMPIEIISKIGKR